MKPIRIAINGFGRIGRTAFKIALSNPQLEVVAVNDISSIEVLAHLLRYDTAYGRFDKTVEETANGLRIDGRDIQVLAEKDPSQLPWKKLNVDVVLESTGRFVKDGAARAHLDAGARGVVISAPVKGTGDVPTFIMGVNNDDLKGHTIISNASCTTNCVAPVTKIMLEHFGIAKATMTTIHSYTAEQNLVDGPVPPMHPDLRRARAAAQNIVPTTSGAAISTTEVLPELKGLFDGFAFRVPTLTVSVTDFTFLTKKKTTIEEVNDAFRKAAQSKAFAGVLTVSEEQLVSSDFKMNPHSAIVDLPLTNVVDGDLVKVVAWYDNEWGYANRFVEQALHVGRALD